MRKVLIAWIFSNKTDRQTNEEKEDERGGGNSCQRNINSPSDEAGRTGSKKVSFCRGKREMSHLGFVLTPCMLFSTSTNVVSAVNF